MIDVSKIIRGSLAKILLRWISPRILLPAAKYCRGSRQDRAFILAAKDLVEIRESIPARFWPPRSCFPARISMRFAVGSRRDFGRRESQRDSRQDPGEILAAEIFASRRESRRDSRQDPGKILAAEIFASRRESRRDSWQDPGEILAAGNFASRWESCRDPAEVPAKKKNPGGQKSPLNGLTITTIRFSNSYLHYLKEKTMTLLYVELMQPVTPIFP